MLRGAVFGNARRLKEGALRDQGALLRGKREARRELPARLRVPEATLARQHHAVAVLDVRQFRAPLRLRARAAEHAVVQLALLLREQRVARRPAHADVVAEQAVRGKLALRDLGALVVRLYIPAGRLLPDAGLLLAELERRELGAGADRGGVR